MNANYESSDGEMRLVMMKKKKKFENE